MDTLVDVAIQKYAPLPERSLRDLTGRLCHAVPQWRPARPAIPGLGLSLRGIDAGTRVRSLPK